MNSKTKGLIVIAIIVISIIIVAGVFYIILNTNGKINQGSFRVNDVILKSTIDIEQIQENPQDTSKIEDMSLNLSQNNTLSMLITKGSQIKDIYIDKIEISKPKKQGEVYISSTNSEEKFMLDDTKKEFAISYQDKTDQYLVEININNSNFIKSVSIPEGTKTVKFDGTILNILNISLDDIKLKVSFNLNIIDELGKNNICKISLNIPNNELITSGIGLSREDLSNYVFIVK